MNLNKEYELLDKAQEKIRQLFAIEKEKQCYISTMQSEDFKPETQRYLFTARKEYEQDVDNCDELTKKTLSEYLEIKKQLSLTQ
jgi:hypothetical protein